MNNNFFLLKGEDLINFINNNTRKSMPYNFIDTVGHKIKEKYNPRLDYLEVIDKIYFEEE